MSLVCGDCSMPLPKTSPDMSPTPTQVKSARWNPHRLVVITRRSARGIGIAEPEPVFRSDRVGDVGEGRGALIGRDDQIRIIAVMTHHIGWRNDGAAD